MSAPVPLRLRPLEIGDLLDETFRMYRRHFALFAGISVILSIPAAALSGYTSYSLLNALIKQAATRQPPDLNSYGSTLGALAVGLVLSMTLIPFSYGAVTYAVCESAQGREVTAWGVVRGVLRKYFQLGGYVILIVLMALFFCLLPLWIWIWVAWICVIPVMFVEDTGLIQAMGRSWHLVEGSWWRTFLILVLLFVLNFAVSAALGAFMSLAQFLTQIIFSTVAVTWVFSSTGIVISSLVDPIIQIAVVLIYFDLRVRREGLDLFQLAQRLAAPA